MAEADSFLESKRFFLPKLSLDFFKGTHDRRLRITHHPLTHIKLTAVTNILLREFLATGIPSSRVLKKTAVRAGSSHPTGPHADITPAPTVVPKDKIVSVRIYLQNVKKLEPGL